MKTLVSVIKKYKPWIISILILFLVIKISFQNKYHTYLEAFTTSPTPTSDSSHSIYNFDGSQKTDYPSLTNIIVKRDKNRDNYLENGFINLYKRFGKSKFDESSYSTTIPQLIIQSYPECPTLYNLFRAYPKLGAETKIKYYSNFVEKINKKVEDAIGKLEGSIKARDVFMKDLEKYRDAYSDFTVNILSMQDEEINTLKAANAPSAEIKVKEETSKTTKEIIDSTFLSPSPAPGPAFGEPTDILFLHFKITLDYDNFYSTKLDSLLINTPIKKKFEELEQQLNKIYLLRNGMNELYSNIINSITDIKNYNFFKFNLDKKNEFENSLGNEVIDKVGDFKDRFKVEEDIDSEVLEKIKKLPIQLKDLKEDLKYTYIGITMNTYEENIVFNLIYTKELYLHLTDSFKFDTIDIQKQFACETSDYAIDFKFNISDLTPNSVEDIETFNLEELENFVELIFSGDRSNMIEPKNVNEIYFNLKKHIGIIDTNLKDIDGIRDDFQEDCKKVVCVLEYNKLKTHLTTEFTNKSHKYISTHINSEIESWIKNQIKCYSNTKKNGPYLYHEKDKIWTKEPYDSIKKTPAPAPVPAIDTDTELCQEDIPISPSDSADTYLSKHLDLSYIDSQSRSIYPVILEIYKLFYLGENKIFDKDVYPLKYINIEDDKPEKSQSAILYFLPLGAEYNPTNKFDFTFYKNDMLFLNYNVKYDELKYIFKKLSKHTEPQDDIHTPCPSDDFEELSPSPSVSKNIILETIKAAPDFGFSCHEINKYFGDKGYIIYPGTLDLKTELDELKAGTGDIHTKIEEIITYLDSSSISPSPSGAPATYLTETCKDTTGTPPTAIPNIFNDLKCYLEDELEPVKNNYLQSKIDLHNVIQYIFRLNELKVLEQKVSKDESNLAAKELQSEIETKLREIIEKKYRQNENRVGIEHRMKIQRQFFNLNQDIRVDYPLLDITVYDKNNDEFTPIVPQIYFSNQMYDTEEDFNIKAKGTEVLRYLEKGYDQRNSHFAVQEDFSFPDILKFMDYSFTTLCWGAINIRLMKPTHNHYYAFPCQNSNCQNGTNSYFYLLPTKIVQLCRDEGKEYTRAKCNRCSSNVIVYFDTIPNKFINLAKYQGSEDNTDIEDLIPSSS